jgi:alanine racemase
MPTPRLIHPVRRPGEIFEERYGRPTRAEIDLGAVAANARAVRTVVGPAARVLGVVKADAYGHGAVPVARALEASGACAGLAVSLVEEGLELRRGGVVGPILVMGSVYTQAHLDVLVHELTPVISGLEDIARFEAAARQRGERAKVHVKIDTGMARLGVRPDALTELAAALAQAPHVDAVGVMTHLACADVPGAAGHDATLAQLDRFDAALVELAALGLQPSIIHAANSAGALRFARARYGAVRPGLLLYGGSDERERLGLCPAMRLSSAIVQLRTLEPGDCVSYGGLWRAPVRSRIATVPIGYADGYPRRVQLGARPASVLIRGRRCPVVGAVCMDMIMVDVTALGDGAQAPPVQIGDEVVLLGGQGSECITAGELAELAGLIEYEITCGVSKRVPRVYQGGQAL